MTFGEESPSFPPHGWAWPRNFARPFWIPKIAAAEKAAEAKPDYKGVPTKKDLKFEALIPYLKGEKPVVFGAYESYEVEVAMSIAKEFNPSCHP